MDQLQVRFWAYVDTEGDCWLWRAGRFADGYVMFNVDCRPRLAHRVAFEFVNGPIPAGALVIHGCDDRACVRLDHLFLGDAAARAAVREARGRTARADQHGSKTHRDRVPRAEHHYARQFSCADVRTIRRRYASGHVTTRQLADEYGVRQNSIWKIVTGRSWQEPRV